MSDSPVRALYHTVISAGAQALVPVTCQLPADGHAYVSSSPLLKHRQLQVPATLTLMTREAGTKLAPRKKAATETRFSNIFVYNPAPYNVTVRKGDILAQCCLIILPDDSAMKENLKQRE